MCGRAVFSAKIQFNWMQSETTLPDALGGIRVPGDLIVAAVDASAVDTKLYKWGFFNGAVYNARSERVLEHKSWEPWAQNRVLLPLKRFYEGGKWFRARSDEEPETLAVAGLYNDNEEVTMLTRPAFVPVDRFHHRMPFTFHNMEDAHAFLNRKDDFSILELATTSSPMEMWNPSMGS